MITRLAGAVLLGGALAACSAPRTQQNIDAGAPIGSDWSTTAAVYRGMIGTRVAYRCVPGGSAGTVWGTDIFTDDSSVCTAGVHAGLITLSGGGTVVIEIRPGAPAYDGSFRNGITSVDYGAWTGSFVFP
ncbi:MAG: LCCL domain-containing protein [Deltaproteobacteria bacterium]